MFQTDQPTASATLPTPAAAATPGYFTNGNPVSGVPATILDADFVNMIMMELVNVVLAAGLTPSKTTYTQVRDALAALYVTPGQFPSSLSANGYQKLPSGLILQWGSGITTNGVLTQTLPIAFPTVQFAASAVVTGGGNFLANLFSLTTTQIVVDAYIANTGATGSSIGSVPINWIAVGH